MVGVTATSLLCLIIAWTTVKIWTWRRAYTAARSTKFPVFLSPVHINDTWWLMFHPLLLPLLDLLPRSWAVPWLSLAQVWKIWKFGPAPFQSVGHDTLVLATPQGNILWTCDASLCHQFETSPSKVRVPVDAIKFFEVYGPAIGTVEGPEWKTYRKVVTSAFTPATHQAVWTETVRHTQSLIEHWAAASSSESGARRGGGGRDAPVVHVVKHSTSRLALHVICAVFFNKHLEWRDHGQGYEPAPPAHKVSFEQAMFTVVSRLGVLAVTPRALLGVLPIPRVREAHIAFTEWAAYMEELREAANTRLAAKEKDAEKPEPKNVLEAIILAGRHDSDDSLSHSPSITEASVLGNIFFTIMAGHETVGNALAFAILLLAIYPEYQTLIHSDMQPLLATHPSLDSWSVEHEYSALQRGWLGAVLKEVLRPYGVVSFITRRVVADMRVTDGNGEVHVVPSGTLVSLDYAAVFRDPRTWKAREGVGEARRRTLGMSPALDFDPGRWMGSKSGKGAAHGMEGGVRYEEVEEKEDSNTKAATAGGDGGTGVGAAPAVFPFGQGPRTCPGRTFAFVEMTAALATILKDYEVRLMVSERVKQEWGGDEVRAWEETRDEAILTLYDKIESNITIELNEELPIQLVRRS